MDHIGPSPRPAACSPGARDPDRDSTDPDPPHDGPSDGGEPDSGGVAADVRAGGVVVLRPGRRVLLVHRPKYDDWSFPKGKLERGEHATAAAVREVAEETGLHVRLGVPLATHRYPVAAGRMKSVHYWVGRAVGDDDVSGYRPNAEIDAVGWFDPAQASATLSYDRDRETLIEAMGVRRKTRVLVVARHATARSRRAWRGDDTERPLLSAGEQIAERLVPVLAAYGVSRLVSSTSRRCVQTLAPYADVTGYPLHRTRKLAEEEATPKRIRGLVEATVLEGRGAVLCTHRPVLPEVFAALGVADPHLAPGELAVFHLRKDDVIDVERHRP